MCAQMLYGSILYWHNQPQCGIFATPDGFWKVLIDIGQCDAWVAWVAANAMLHLAWVFVLLICQLYQVSKEKCFAGNTVLIFLKIAL